MGPVGPVGPSAPGSPGAPVWFVNLIYSPWSEKETDVFRVDSWCFFLTKDNTNTIAIPPKVMFNYFA